MKDENYWDERTNFERTKDVHFKSRADWESIQRPKRHRIRALHNKRM